MSKIKAFTGKRAPGCVTYLREGYEIPLKGKVTKWGDEVPLMILEIVWSKEHNQRAYLLRDTPGNLQWVLDRDLAEYDGD